MTDNFLKNNNLLQLEKIREDIFPRLLHNYNHFWNDFRKEISLKFYKNMEKILEDFIIEKGMGDFIK